MNQNLLRQPLIQSIVKVRVVMSILAVALGAVCIAVALRFVNGALQPILNSIGGAVLGAGLLTLVTAFTLPQQVADLIKHDDLTKAIREAFEASHELYQDGHRLGVSRIFGHLADLKRDIPVKDLVRDAEVVYFMGTSLSAVTLWREMIADQERTKFRFLFVAISDGPLPAWLGALEVIHDVRLTAKLAATSDELRAIQALHSNVEWKALSFVPPFSAILAVGGPADRRWGRLQTDHYLLRTSADARFWLYLEDHKSPLFQRLQQVIENAWKDPARYDCVVQSQAHAERRA